MNARSMDIFWAIYDQVRHLYGGKYKKAGYSVANKLNDLAGAQIHRQVGNAAWYTAYDRIHDEIGNQVQARVRLVVKNRIKAIFQESP